MTKLNGSQILMETLLEQNVDTIFGYPGGSVLNIYDALYDYRGRVNHVITAHEQGAAHAADGYARLTGKVGVVLATSGPGATNLITGIATAYMDSVPMVAITGNVSNNLIGLDSFQEVYIAGITMPITKHNFVVRDVEDLADTVREAFRIAKSGRPGPVLVDIPKDVTAAICDYVKMPAVQADKTPTVDVRLIAEAAEIINNAKRPAVLFGGGVESAGASAELREFIAKGCIPACHTLMAAGELSYGERLNLGLVGMHGSFSAGRMLAESDVVVALGTRFSDRVATDKTHFAKKARIIHIDIDAAEINKNVPCEMGIIGDVKQVLNMMLPLIKSVERERWLAEIDEWRKDDFKPVDTEDTLTPHAIMSAVNDAVGEDGVIVTDVGQHQMWAAQYCRRTRSRSFLTSGGLGTMGYGYGAAIGAQYAAPKRRVIHLTGDGCFHMNLNEMCTSVTYNLPIVTVVFDNQVLGMVRQWQTEFYNKRYCATTLERKTDYVKLAEAFGATGYKVKTEKELREALDKAYASGRPCVIDAVIDRDEKVLPMIPAGKTVDDIILN